MKDARGRPDLSFLKDLHPVGRLDADTSGLLLLSSNGKLSNLLLDPTTGLSRVYDAIVNGTVDTAALSTTLRAGVATSDGTFTANLLDSHPMPASRVSASFSSHWHSFFFFFVCLLVLS